MADLDVAGARAFAERGHRLGDLIEGLRVPVIAAVNGWALGAGHFDGGGKDEIAIGAVAADVTVGHMTYGTAGGVHVDV